jgi:hypothetical protein
MTAGDGINIIGFVLIEVAAFTFTPLAIALGKAFGVSPQTHSQCQNLKAKSIHFP